MKSVLLVDDDHLVRSYLKMLKVWDKAGFEIRADARDGEEALQEFEKQAFDLVMTDIAMPLMDGIKLIREIRRRNRNVFIIVLSCHDEFQYVKDAMREGADEYVLKSTLDEESLYLLLEEAKKQMKCQRGSGISSGTPQSEEQADDYNRISFFNRLLSGNMQGEEPAKEKGDPGVQALYRQCAVIAMKLDNKDTVDDPLTEIRTDRCCIELVRRLRRRDGDKTQLSENGTHREIIYLGNGVLCCFLDFSNVCKSSVMYQSMTDCAMECCKMCQNEQRVYKIGVSSICMGAEGLRQAYQQARAMIKLGFYDQNNIIYYEPGKKSGSRLPDLAEEFISRVECRKYINDREALQKNVGRVLEQFCLELTDQRLVWQWMRKVRVSAGIELQCEEPDSIRDVEDFLKRAVDEMSGHAGGNVYENLSVPVKIAVEYVLHHFREPIGLIDAAREAGVNSSYLSYLFGQEMGIGFAGYLRNIRLDYAEKLLRESRLKIRKVAEDSGFHDYHYFSKVFRKKNGISPAEFRRQNSDDSD